jgi:DNA-binding NarL/FixJ family response regulator
MINIAVVEDNRLMREGIAALLNDTDECWVVAATEVLDIPALKDAGPEVLLIDVGAHNGDSLEMVRTAARELPDARIIMMDFLAHSEEVSAFVNEGVAGFIMKAATLEDMVVTIQAVAAGRNVLPDELTSVLFDQIADDTVSWTAQQARDGVRMTPREKEVIELILEGLSNKRIASRLDIAPQTVKSHVRNIMDKLALHTRLQIAAHFHSGPGS